MPKNKYRVTLDLPFEMRRQIETLRAELAKTTGKHISKNKLVAELLSQQLERLSAKRSEETS